MAQAYSFDKALDEAFKLIIQDRLQRARQQLLANVQKIKARKQEQK